jgi:hypothetical protein
MTGDSPASSGDGPVLRVVAGDPSAEELAALTVALAAVLAARGAPGQPRRSSPGWADRSRMMGAPPAPGPDAWPRSARPR